MTETKSKELLERIREMLDEYEEEVKQMVDEDYDTELHKELGELYLNSRHLFIYWYQKITKIMSRIGWIKWSDIDNEYRNEYYIGADQSNEREYVRVKVGSCASTVVKKADKGTLNYFQERPNERIVAIDKTIRNFLQEKPLKALEDLDTLLYVLEAFPIIWKLFHQSIDEKVFGKVKEYTKRYEKVKEKLEKLEEED